MANKVTSGLMRYTADVRPLAVVAVTLALTVVPFVTHLPWYAAVPFWGLMLWLRSFGPYAQHNHGHLRTFNVEALNFGYDVLLAQTTGYPTALWELHHNRGHHRHYLTPEKDVARIYHLDTGEMMSRWYYALRGNLTIVRDSIRIGFEEKAAGRKSLHGKLAGEMAVQLAITAAAVAVNPLVALVWLVIPNAIMAWMIWWESYPHHKWVPGTKATDASVTITSEIFNWMNFNIGHHTAHHEKPTLHWSLLPARTAAILSEIHPSCIRPDTGPGLLVSDAKMPRTVRPSLAPSEAVVDSEPAVGEAA